MLEWMLRFIAVLCFTSLSTATWANSLVLSPGRTSISSSMAMLVDPAGRLTVDDVAIGRAGQFKPAQQPLGPTTDVFWGKVDLDFGPKQRVAPTYLIMDPTLIGRIDVFTPKDEGGFVVSTVDERETISARTIPVRPVLFELPAETVGITSIYIRFEPRGHPLQTRMYWVSSSVAIADATSAQLTQGLLYGALVALLLYNGFLYFATRDLWYLLYVYYLGAFTLLMSWLTGTRPVDFAGANAVMVAALNSAVIQAGLWFFSEAMDLRKNSPNLAKLFYVLQCIAIGLLILTPLGFSKITYPSSLLLIGLVQGALITAAAVRWRQGFQPAIYSMCGLIVHAAVSVIFVVDLVGACSVPFISIYHVEFGAVWEALFSSFALAYRVKLAESETKKMISAQKILLTAEQDARAAADLATKEKNVVLSMISHELRSPLQAMVAALEVERSKSLGGHHDAFLRKLERSTTRIASHLRDLFILSVGETGRLEMRPEAFEVADLLEGVVQGVVDQFDAKGLSVQVNGPKPTYVVADPTRVEQVMSNLIENAFKYTDTGEVRINFSLHEATLVFSVTDSGRGISAAQQQELFVPYRRFGSVERDRVSSGIGLAVVKTLVTHLGGTVTLESRLGQGSTFTVEIPVTRCGAPDESSDEHVEEARISMLIVDDRQDVLEALCSLAETIDYACDAAASAAIAANKMAARYYDVVLIDLDMPVKTGQELASEIRRGNGRNSDAFLVAISAGTGEAGGLVPDADGSIWPFDAFLRKPVDRQSLKKLVESGPYSGMQ